DLLRGLVVRLVLGGHPHLGGLLDDLLADRVHAGVELCDRARTLGARDGLGGELLEEGVERLHPARLPGPRACGSARQRTPSRSITNTSVRPLSRWPAPAGP